MPRVYGVRPKFQSLLRSLSSSNAGAIVFAILGLHLGFQLPIVRVIAPIQWIVLVLLLMTIETRARGALVDVRGRTS